MMRAIAATTNSNDVILVVDVAIIGYATVDVVANFIAAPVACVAILAAPAADSTATAIASSKSSSLAN